MKELNEEQIKDIYFTGWDSGLHAALANISGITIDDLRQADFNDFCGRPREVENPKALKDVYEKWKIERTQDRKQVMNEADIHCGKSEKKFMIEDIKNAFSVAWSHGWNYRFSNPLDDGNRGYNVNMKAERKDYIKAITDETERCTCCGHILCQKE